MHTPTPNEPHLQFGAVQQQKLTAGDVFIGEGRRVLLHLQGDEPVAHVLRAPLCDAARLELVLAPLVGRHVFLRAVT